MHRLLFFVSVAPLVIACGTDDNLFGEAASATGSASTEGAGATGGASGQGADGGKAGPGPGPASGSGGAGNTGGKGNAGGGGSTGEGGGPIKEVGCSDGEREYFTDAALHQHIAGCDAGFAVPGVTTAGSMMPTCGRISGDDSSNPEGTECSVEDACAEGWHVCVGANEVAALSGTGACEPLTIDLPRFYITRQVQDDDQPAQCAGAPFTNNILGCGTLGDPPGPSCAPLDRRMRFVECVPTANWYCGNDINDAAIEAEIVQKVGSGEGGVLCCKG